MKYDEALEAARKGFVIRRTDWPNGHRLRLVGGTLMRLIGNRKSERYVRNSPDAHAIDWQVFKDVAG